MDVKVYKCFIASPGDTSDERKICDKVFNEINKSIGENYNFRIESLKWENDTRPAFGDYSQAVVSEQMGNEYELFIGIMYKKFGTPTKVAGSGTEEEFDNAYKQLLDNKKLEIMFYFNELPTKISEIDITELSKVLLFKNKIKSLNGYYWSYSGIQDFEESLRNHLNLFFTKEYKNAFVIDEKKAL